MSVSRHLLALPEQFARMATGERCDLMPAEHARQFIDPCSFLQLIDEGPRSRPIDPLPDEKMGVRIPRNLGLMRDAQNLI